MIVPVNVEINIQTISLLYFDYQVPFYPYITSPVVYSCFLHEQIGQNKVGSLIILHGLSDVYTFLLSLHLVIVISTKMSAGVWDTLKQCLQRELDLLSKTGMMAKDREQRENW